MKLKQHNEYTVLWADEDGLFDPSNCKGNGWDTFSSITEVTFFVEHLIKHGIKREAIKVLCPTSEMIELPAWDPKELTVGRTIYYVDYDSNPILTFPTVQDVYFTKDCCSTGTFDHHLGGVALDFGSTDEYPEGKIICVPFEDIGVSMFLSMGSAVAAITKHYNIDNDFWCYGYPKILHATCEDGNEDYELVAVTSDNVAYYKCGSVLYRYDGPDVKSLSKDVIGIPVCQYPHFECALATHGSNSLTTKDAVLLLDPDTKWINTLQNIYLQKHCSQCNAKTVWEDEHGILLYSSDDLPGMHICRCCMEEHCNTTNCLQCDYGKYPDCKYRYLKSV